MPDSAPLPKDAAVPRRAPLPYATFRHLTLVLDWLHAQSGRPVLDAATLERAAIPGGHSGHVELQLAMRALGLVDAHHVTTTALLSLARSDDRAQSFLALTERLYPEPLAALRAGAGRDEIEEAFEPLVPSARMRRRAVTFFISLASASGVSTDRVRGRRRRVAVKSAPSTPAGAIAVESDRYETTLLDALERITRSEHLLEATRWNQFEAVCDRVDRLRQVRERLRAETD